MPIVPYKTEEAPCAPHDVGMLVNTTSKNIPLGLPPAFPFRVATPSCLEGLTHLLLRSSLCYMSRVSAPLVPQEVNLERFSLETANTHTYRMAQSNSKSTLGASIIRIAFEWYKVAIFGHFFLTRGFVKPVFTLIIIVSASNNECNSPGVSRSFGEDNDDETVNRTRAKYVLETNEVEEMDEWARETRNEVKIDSAVITISITGASKFLISQSPVRDPSRGIDFLGVRERRRDNGRRTAIKSHQKFHFAITDAKSKRNHGRFVNYIFHGYFLLLNITFVRKWDYDYRSQSVNSSKFVIQSWPQERVR
ncbi:hypothetical protein ALC62_04608 [Cyphomyrmex costatus]|uniref:Uncharacterized protein n=1 Tax=Cyphomyrmex costatus TaxID=456900 RepID=A0A195CVB7_9HYME|nr:hypothetical protein ALC62_04608 [Cyphomyrmex costatus]